MHQESRIVWNMLCMLWLTVDIRWTCFKYQQALMLLFTCTLCKLFAAPERALNLMLCIDAKWITWDSVSCNATWIESTGQNITLASRIQRVPLSDVPKMHAKVPTPPGHNLILPSKTKKERSCTTRADKIKCRPTRNYRAQKERKTQVTRLLLQIKTRNPWQRCKLSPCNGNERKIRRVK